MTLGVGLSGWFSKSPVGGSVSLELLELFHGIGGMTEFEIVRMGVMEWSHVHDYVLIWGRKMNPFKKYLK